MATGTIIFLVLIAVLVLVLGVNVIWQCCDIRRSITEFKKEPSLLYYDLLSLSGRAYSYVSPDCDDEFREQIYKEEILRLMRRPKQPESENASKSGLSPESTTPKGTITPPSSFSDIELRKYCIEQTRKDQMYLRIEDAQRLYEYILNGRQERKEESNGEF